MCLIVKLWILLSFSHRHPTDTVTSPKTRFCRMFGFFCRVHTQVHVCFVHMCLHGTPVLLCLQWPRDVTSFHVTVACAHMLLCLSTILEVSEIDRRIKHTRLVSAHVQCDYPSDYTNTEANIVLGCMSTERLCGKFWLDVVSTVNQVFITVQETQVAYRKHKYPSILETEVIYGDGRRSNRVGERGRKIVVMWVESGVLLWFVNVTRLFDLWANVFK